MLGAAGPLRGARPALLCVVSLEAVPSLLAALATIAVPGSGDREVASAEVALPVANARPHVTTRTPLLEDVVRHRYAIDAQLWKLVHREQRVCLLWE